MNAEQKQALIERCEKISQWREKYGDYANVMLPAVEAQQIAQIALATLTALPVKLPGKCKVSDRAHETRMAYAEGLNHGIELARNAIVEAGYQVEGE